MQLYEYVLDEIDIGIKLKCFDPSEIMDLITSVGSLAPMESRRLILETIVSNLKTEIIPALRVVPEQTAAAVLTKIYNSCVMLNPKVDPIAWMQLVQSDVTPKPAPAERKTRKTASKVNTFALEEYLKSCIIGQNEAIESIIATFKRVQAGLNEENRPLSVFIFAGTSGVGKTALAKNIHSFLFGQKAPIIRIDCGEYQHKHENAKLLGAPNGYIGYDRGSPLVNDLKENPNTVILFDEIEKAHPDLWNTFLHAFDEGYLKSATGDIADLTKSVIILTTNLGNSDFSHEVTADKVGFLNKSTLSDAKMRDMLVKQATDSIKKHFSVEFLNRIDKIVVFNTLKSEDLLKIAELELKNLQEKLQKNGYVLQYSQDVLDKMITNSITVTEGARGIARTRRESIDSVISERICGTTKKKKVLTLKTSIDGFEVE